MSKHFFQTIHHDEPTTISMGWDKSLPTYFMEIKMESDGEAPLWSNLYYEPSNPKTLDQLLSVLNMFEIEIPVQMMTEISENGKNNEGNKEVKHAVIDGVYRREILNAD